MLADYQQTVRRPGSQPSFRSTKAQVISHRIAANKTSNQSQRPAEGPAIPSMGPFVNGSDGNLQEVLPPHTPPPPTPQPTSPHSTSNKCVTSL